MQKIIFASDVHLSPSKPELTDLFLEFLKGPCQSADALYLLGDIFEGWVGDDDRSQFNSQIEQALLEYTLLGKQLYFMAGNRDFLIGTDFAKRTGCKLLPEPTVIDLFGNRTLLLHGDTLCTLDIKYQNFRKKVRNPWTQKIFLALPLKWRHKIFNGFRNTSKKSVSQKSMQIMDVNPATVLETFAKFNISQMIHGHVHRPFTHVKEAENSRRIVLGDWGITGSYIESTVNNTELKSFHSGVYSPN